MTDWNDRDFRNAEDGEESELLDESIPPSSPIGDDDGEPVTLASWPLIIAAGIALVLGLGLYWLFSEKGPVTVPPTETAMETPSEAEPAPPPEAEPEEPEVDLPALSESDAFIRELLSGLSRHPAMTSLLLSDELVRKIVAAIVNVAEGDHPARHFPYLKPDEAYSIVSRPPRMFADPRGHHRYDVLVAGLESLDPEGVAELYRLTKPLALEAYEELGYLDEPFEVTFAKAIDVLLATPVVDGRIELEADSVNYTYTDSRLESLAPAQKQLLRMGPDNTRTVQTKIRAIARAMKLPIDS